MGTIFSSALRNKEAINFAALQNETMFENSCVRIDQFLVFRTPNNTSYNLNFLNG